ncbi:MAG: sigma-70 family RNA polymerase sigma factor [Planctomycetia bacterium]|nr:sigma-70 family RNA polymerase sigma factor [Planctomycetia bacterium]
MQTLWKVFQQKPVVQGDAQLLHAFVRHKSEEAFSSLVQRHGGMVLGVCQRILGHTQDAEDAFQATFLVLARKAGSLHGNSTLGPWLYGVARRVAMKARSKRPHQTSLNELDCFHEVEEASDMATSKEWSELRPIIDDEIARLPGHYQEVVILCQINGLTKQEAARQLGCPEGTVSSRLMRARELLQTRLTRRGIALTSLGMLDLTLLASPVTAQLVQRTVSTAMQVALGASLTAGISTSVLTLAQGATQAMFMTKLKLAALGLTVIGGLSLGTTYVAGGWGQDKPGKGNSTSAIKPALPLPGSSTGKSNSEPAGNLPDTALTHAKLNKIDPIVSNMFSENPSLAEGLASMERQAGIQCIVDSSAFRKIFVDFDQKLLREQQVSLPRMPNQSVSTVLHALLDNLQYQQQSLPCTYMIRQGTLVIVPKSFIAEAANEIEVAFNTRNEDIDLAQALERLSDESGVSIILDPRSKPTATDCKVNTTFRNIKLINAVKLLANMADLTVINIDGALYVSTSENSRKVQEEVNRDLPKQ